MSLQNRVNPYGEIVANAARGAWMGTAVFMTSYASPSVIRLERHRFERLQHPLLKRALQAPGTEALTQRLARLAMRDVDGYMIGAAVKSFAPAALPYGKRSVPVYYTRYNARVTMIKGGATQQDGSENLR